MTATNIHQFLGEFFPNGFLCFALDETGTPVALSEFKDVSAALTLQHFGKNYCELREEQLKQVIKEDYLGGAE